MSKDTGGPAFPSKKRIFSAGYPTNNFEPASGMTMRDYFAAFAMQGMLSAGAGDMIKTAEEAYCQADFMLKARAQ